MKKATGSYSINNNTYKVFLYPAIIAIFILIVVPFGFAFYLSFHDLNLLSNQGNMTFIGFDNFKHFFNDKRIVNSSIVTIKLFVFTITLETLLGLFIALLLDRRFKGKNIVRTVILIPMFMTTVVAGLAWRAMLDPMTGIINWILGDPRIEFLGSAKYALYTVGFVDAWQWTPFMVIMFMASLDSISNEYYEAAYIDGANEWLVIRYIKLPMIRNSIIISMILRGIEIMKLFGTLYVMTSGGPGNTTETFNMYAYTVGFQYFRIGYATTITFIFALAVTLIIGFFIFRQQKKNNVFGE